MNGRACHQTRFSGGWPGCDLICRLTRGWSRGVKAGNFPVCARQASLRRAKMLESMRSADDNNAIRRCNWAARPPPCDRGGVARYQGGHRRRVRRVPDADGQTVCPDVPRLRAIRRARPGSQAVPITAVLALYPRDDHLYVENIAVDPSAQGLPA
jgi:hypothetical protein